MKRYRWLLGCCLFLSIGNANGLRNEPDLRMLQTKGCSKAEIWRGYVGVCKYSHQNGRKSELLLLYADLFINWLQKARSGNNLVEYYIWVAR